MSVRVKTMEKAIAECKRFLAAAEELKRCAGSTEYTKGDPWYCGCRYCAAAERASMDLSKALADVRRGSSLTTEDATPSKVRLTDGLGPLPARWYCVSRDGLATLCLDESDAREMAAECTRDFPRQAPYRAVLMGDMMRERERCIEDRERMRTALKIARDWLPWHEPTHPDYEGDRSDAGRAVRLAWDQDCGCTPPNAQVQPGREAPGESEGGCSASAETEG